MKRYVVFNYATGCYELMNVSEQYAYAYFHAIENLLEDYNIENLDELENLLKKCLKGDVKKMSKELDSVELARIEFEKHLEDDPNNEWLKRLIKGLKMAEQSLQRLETIDNSNPSEELEILLKAKQVCDVSCVEMCNNCQKRSAYNSVKAALLKAQENENARTFGKDIINLNKTLKQSIDEPILYTSRYGNKYIVPQELFEEQGKALEIIENKNVDILDIRMSKTVDNYNFAISSSNLNRKELTQEEFNTLKRYCNKKDRSE